MISYVRREPAATAALVLALTSALAIDEAWTKVVMAVLALVLGGAVRSQVTPVSESSS